MNIIGKITLVICLGLVTGCGVQVPVKGQTSDDNNWVGYYNTKKHFEMTNGDTTCTGKAETSWSDITILIPFECSDGRTGILKENKAMTGKALVTFSDGSSGNFSMGHGI